MNDRSGIDSGAAATIIGMMVQSMRFCLNTAIEAGATPDQIRLIVMEGALGSLRQVDTALADLMEQSPATPGQDEDDGA